MHSYHVHFSARKGVTDEDLVAQVRAFMESQLLDNRLQSYRILKNTNKASFEDLLDYHLIADYASKADLDAAFAHMSDHYKEEPHSPLMRMTGAFKVSFSENV